MNVRQLVSTAAIAAIYAVLTIVSAGIGYGPVQFRVAEALIVLVLFSPKAMPGLVIGCVLANILGPYGIIDMVCGGVATLIAVILVYVCRKNSIIALMWPVIINAVIIGAEIHFAFGVPNLLFCMGAVAAGEFVSCFLLGQVFYRFLLKHRNFTRYIGFEE